MWSPTKHKIIETQRGTPFYIKKNQHSVAAEKKNPTNGEYDFSLVINLFWKWFCSNVDISTNPIHVHCYHQIWHKNKNWRSKERSGLYTIIN